MPSKPKTFTDAGIEKMTPPKSRMDIKDALVPGLQLRVSPGGAKTFSLVYKVRGEGGVDPQSGLARKGPQKRITLGRFPSLKIAEARRLARVHLEAAEAGIDPGAAVQEERRHRDEHRFDTVLQRYIDQVLKPHLKSWKNVARNLEIHALPAFGDTPLADLKRADIHAALDGIAAKGQTGAAREVRKNLSALFNWAADRAIIEANPMTGMRREDLAAKDEAGRELTFEELRRVWRAAESLGYPFARFYQLLILTGQRRNDWAQARWSEIDLSGRRLTIPARRYKSGRDHTVALAEAAVRVLEACPRFAEGHYVLTTTAGRTPVSGFSKAKAALDRQIAALGGIQPFRIHDLRVTCESRLAELGFNQEIRDSVLGHARRGLQRTYNKFDYFDEKMQAMTAYAEAILKDDLVNCQP